MAIERLSVDELATGLKEGQFIVVQEVTRNKPRQWVFQGERLMRIEEQDAQGASFPKDAEIVLVGDDDVCLGYARRLEKYKVRYLAGGHLAWGQFYHAVDVGFDGQVKVWQIHRLAKGCLSYLAASGQEAVIIDPSYHIDYFLGLAHAQKTDIRSVIDTRIHRDHVSGGGRLADKTGSPYYVPAHENLDAKSHPLEEQDEIVLGEARMKVIPFDKTERDNVTSVGLLLNGRFLFSGDIDLAADKDVLFNATDREIREQEDDPVLVLPAHARRLGRINEHGIVATTLGELQKGSDAVGERGKAIATTRPEVSEENIFEINLMQQQISLDRANDLELGLD